MIVEFSLIKRVRAAKRISRAVNLVGGLTLIDALDAPGFAAELGLRVHLVLNFLNPSIVKSWQRRRPLPPRFVHAESHRRRSSVLGRPPGSGYLQAGRIRGLCP